MVSSYLFRMLEIEKERMKMKRKNMLFLAIAVIAIFGIALGAMLFNGNTTAKATEEKVTVQEVLRYAMNDEQEAKATYGAIMEKYGDVAPFNRIIQAEERHITLLEPLMDKYNVTMPEEKVEIKEIPATLEEAYALGVKAEEENIAMYEAYLQEDVPDDVKQVITQLMNDSKKHLQAFTRATNGELMQQNGVGHGNMNGNGQQGGKGMQGNGMKMQQQNGDCVQN